MNILEKISDSIIDNINFNSIDSYNGYLIEASPLIKSILRTQVKSEYYKNVTGTLNCKPIYNDANGKIIGIDLLEDDSKQIDNYMFNDYQLDRINTLINERVMQYKDAIKEVCLEDGDDLKNGKTNMFTNCPNLRCVIWNISKRPTIDLLKDLFSGCPNIDNFVYHGQPINLKNLNIGDFEATLDKIDKSNFSDMIPTKDDIEKMANLYLYDSLVYGREMETLKNSADIDEIRYHKEMQSFQLSILRETINKMRLYLYGIGNTYDEMLSYNDTNAIRVIKLLDTNKTDEEISNELYSLASEFALDK